MATTHIQSLEHGTCDSGKGLSNNMFIVYGVEAAWNKVLYFDYWAGTSIQPKHIYVNDSWIDSWYCCIFILASPCLNVSSLITFVARKKGDAEETVRLKPAPASTSMNIEGTSTLTVCLVFVLRLWFENFWTGGWTTRINLEYSRDPSKTFQNPGGYGDELGLRTSYNLWGGHWVMLRVFEFHRLKLRGKTPWSKVEVLNCRVDGLTPGFLHIFDALFLLGRLRDLNLLWIEEVQETDWVCWHGKG